MKTEPCAIYFESVFSGYAIYDINEDFAIAGYFHNNHEDKPHRHKIYWTAAGTPFIKFNGRRYSLDLFQRTNY